MHHTSTLNPDVLSLSFKISFSKQPVAHTTETGYVTPGIEQLGAAPQAFSSLLLDIQDVDSGDTGDAPMCSEYVRDIYKYLQQLEVRSWDV